MPKANSIEEKSLSQENPDSANISSKKEKNARSATTKNAKYSFESSDEDEIVKPKSKGDKSTSNDNAKVESSNLKRTAQSKEEYSSSTDSRSRTPSTERYHSTTVVPAKLPQTMVSKVNHF